MGHLEKFLFETSFDAENAAKAKARAAAAVQTAVEEPPAPTFSEKDLEAARQTAFAAGKAGASRKPTQEQAVPQRAASPSPQPEEPAAVQPLRRAKIA